MTQNTHYRNNMSKSSVRTYKLLLKSEYSENDKHEYIYIYMSVCMARDQSGRIITGAETGAKDANCDDPKCLVKLFRSLQNVTLILLKLPGTRYRNINHETRTLKMFGPCLVGNAQKGPVSRNHIFIQPSVEAG
jgi:hypothetical protein